ncbi:hypothetical protein C8J56DRAFT_1051817 [Mycena floridula]|nr:hypothetical protein C8J56DRAFT_1051817 [Mycena floridula]
MVVLQALDNFLVAVYFLAMTLCATAALSIRVLDQPALPQALGRNALVAQQIRNMRESENDAGSLASQILESAAGYRESASDTRLTGSGRPQNNNLLKAVAAARKGPKATTNTVTKNIMLSAAAKRDGAVTLEATLFRVQKGKKSAISLIADPTCVVSELYPDEMVVIDAFRAIIGQMKTVWEQRHPRAMDFMVMHNVNFQAHKTKQIASAISTQMQHSSTLKDLLAHLRAQEYLDDAGVRARKIQIRVLFIKY